MKKKILSLFLVISLIISLMPAVFAAGSCLKLDKTSVNAGETLTMTYTIPNTVEGVADISLKIKFDTTKFQVEGNVVPTDAFSHVDIMTSDDNANTTGEVSITYNGKDGDPFGTVNAGTVLMTVTFRAKTGVNGNADFKVLVAQGAQADGTDISVAAGFVDNEVASTTIRKSAASITIADPGAIVYDGNPVEVGSGKDLNYTYTGDGAVTVKWYADNSSGAVGTELPGAPKDAGTWWIGVSAAEGTGSDAVAEQTRRFTIGRADYTYTRPATDAASIGTALPATASATAAGVLSETVNGELTWYTDDACTAMATGYFDTLGTKDLWWKFTPDAAETNYKTAPSPRCRCRM